MAVGQELRGRQLNSPADTSTKAQLHPDLGESFEQSKDNVCPEQDVAGAKDSWQAVKEWQPCVQCRNAEFRME